MTDATPLAERIDALLKEWVVYSNDPANMLRDEGFAEWLSPRVLAAVADDPSIVGMERYHAVGLVRTDRGQRNVHLFYVATPDGQPWMDQRTYAQVKADAAGRRGSSS